MPQLRAARLAAGGRAARSDSRDCGHFGDCSRDVGDGGSAQRPSRQTGMRGAAKARWRRRHEAKVRRRGESQEGGEDGENAAKRAAARRRGGQEHGEAAGKYVYLFGKKTDGNGTMKPLLGGKGANLAEMCRIGLPVPPGLHHHHRGLHLLLRPQAHAIRRRCKAQMQAGIAALEKQTRQEVRRPEEPAARVGPLRRPRLDAGHDGHDPQPRAQRPDRRGAGEEDRQPALRLGLLPPLRADVRRRRARRAEAPGRGPRAVRDGDRDAQARALSRGHRGHEAHASRT